ncbi:flagellar hook protein [Frateuria sp. Soil773]|uniref:flagellar hook-associated protein FlgL n=1 Tax=Frateuria sp. Soil773 TaxID=1736407 RepID=UPI0006F5CCD9|nr:flagellar hook-associated protein FlgL [Frateuria sp. Soil773]KRE90992.1 flagellar hook protein [Frateuria sp. Soil773]
MRVSTSWMQQQSVNTMLEQQGSLSDLQTQLGTGKRINQPSDDPVGAASALALNHLAADTAQYQRNIGVANGRLGLEEQTLASAGNVLGRVRTLLLEAGSGSQNADTRKDIATEMVQLRQQLLGLANSKDGQGDYLFAGNRTGTAPFVSASGGVGYAGDDGQRMVAAGPGLQVATGDPGSAIFMDVATGNGSFAVSAASGNGGTAVAGASSVADRAAWDGGSYSIVFTAADAYEVRDAGGAVVGSGSYDPAKGGDIGFRGAQVSLSGAPAAGDTFEVAPSGTQDVFGTIDRIVDALRRPDGDQAAMQNELNTQFANLDQAIDSLTRARAGIGARMNALDQQGALNGDLTLQYQGALSDVQDLDYYDAISKLNLQANALQSTQLTYSKLQGLSLFNYLK